MQIFYSLIFSTMSEKTTKIVAAVHANHPNGQRVRAGLHFTTEPQEFEVTAEQLKAIKADEFIHIYKGKKEVEAPEAPQAPVTAPVSAPETTQKTPETPTLPEGEEGDKTPESDLPLGQADASDDLTGTNPEDEAPAGDTAAPVAPEAPTVPNHAPKSTPAKNGAKK